MQHERMPTTRTTLTIDVGLVEQAREMGANISAAARDGVVQAVRTARTGRRRVVTEQSCQIFAVRQGSSTNPGAQNDHRPPRGR
jgi:post-segregation antitoxin (ccd killing protein)